MSLMSAMLGRGPAGLDAPVPVEFASLVLPRSPNACLAAPASHPGFRHVESPVLPCPVDAAFAALLRVVEGFPRTWLRAAWPERRQAQWVERSALMNYPDIITAECVEAPGGCSLFLHSRSLVGYHDLGANAKRVTRWLAALRAAVPAPGEASALSRIVAAAAAGEDVLLVWDDPMEMPEVALRALAAGAASIQVMTPVRPDDGDALLIGAATRLGLSADALLETRAAARDVAPVPMYAAPGAWRPWWMRGRLDAADLRERLPDISLVVDGDDLARLDGDPPHRLECLRATGARQLILRVSVSAESGVALRHAAEMEGPPQSGDGPMMHWFMSEAALEALLAGAGWTITARETDGTALIVTANA